MIKQLRFTRLRVHENVPDSGTHFSLLTHSQTASKQLIFQNTDKMDHQAQIEDKT